jgi:hypothetical protein
MSNGGMKIHHTEFCGTLNHTTSKPAYHDSITNMKTEAIPYVLPINPGDGRTFPWLTGLASRYEKYKFTSLRFTYKPTCSTLKSGGVAICPIYDPADPVPTDRYTLMNAANVVLGPVYKGLSCHIPASCLRPNDTMYVREFHSELIDPTEMRSNDLGYIAVVLTDTDPTNNELENFGDVFVEYTVELIAPRVGARAAKVCHIESVPEQSHPFAPGCKSLFQAGTYKDNTRDLISEHSTLMVDMEHHEAGESPTYVSVDNDDYGYDYSALTFKEPFSGIMTVTSSNNDDTPTRPVGVICNGVDLTTHSDPDGARGLRWTLAQGKQHPHRFARMKPLRTITNGFKAAVHTVKVVAQAGETVALSLAEGAIHLSHFAEVILTEAGPLLLDAMPLLAL